MSVCAIILGTRGQGKSTLAKAIARRFHTSVFYFDPNMQFYAPFEFNDPDAFAEWLATKPAHFEAVYRPTPGNIEEDFSGFVEAIRGAGITDNVAIVIDEASTLQSAHAMNPDLEWLVRQAPQSGRTDATGRTYLGWTVIQTSHRPVDYHGDVRSLVSDWFIFDTRYRRDIGWILDNLPQDIAEDVLENMASLKRYELIHIWSENGTVKYSVWRNPGKWHIKIGR